MKFRHLPVWLALAISCCHVQGQSSFRMRIEQVIPLPGYRGSFDHFAFDAERHRILLAAEDHGTVEVFDSTTGGHLRSLSGFEKPHSILIRPGAATILVTDSGDSKSQLLDASTYRKVRDVALALGANCLLFDAQKNVVYITAGGDRVHLPYSTLLAVNPDTAAVLKSVRLASNHLQPMALDPATNRLFVNMPDKHAVALVNSESLRTLGQWRIDAGSENSPIAFDPALHRLFVVCGKPGILVTLDSDTGKITGTIRVPADADDMNLDTVNHLIFIPGGDGFLGVYDVRNPDRARETARIATRKGAKTGMLLPIGHKYILAEPEAGREAARVVIFNID